MNKLSYFDVIKELEESDFDKLESELFIKTKKFIDKESEKFKDKVFHKVSDDIENWMAERIDNVKQYFFDAVFNYFCGVTYVYISDENKKSIEGFLKDAGYDAKSLRKKIYEENKETIIDELANDIVWSDMERRFKRSFGYWEFSDMPKNYPQTSIVKDFLRLLIGKDGFDDYMNQELDKEIVDKKKELERLKREVKELSEKIEEIV